MFRSSSVASLFKLILVRVMRNQSMWSRVIVWKIIKRPFWMFIKIVRQSFKMIRKWINTKLWSQPSRKKVEFGWPRIGKIRKIVKLIFLRPQLCFLARRSDSCSCGVGQQFRSIFCDRTAPNIERCDIRQTPNTYRECEAPPANDQSCLGEWFIGKGNIKNKSMWNWIKFN